VQRTVEHSTQRELHISTTIRTSCKAIEMPLLVLKVRVLFTFTVEKLKLPIDSEYVLELLEQRVKDDPAELDVVKVFDCVPAEFVCDIE
jgi:hypothetical protein